MAIEFSERLRRIPVYPAADAYSVPDDVVSCICTLTNDLAAEFPAVAARKLGFDRVPLLCAREVPVPGSLPMVIRVLIHYYADDDHEASHVYLGEARRLRKDLEAAQ